MNQSTSPNTLLPPEPATDPASYENDLVLWGEKQVGLLRTRKLEQLDLDNLIEELESMARKERRELVSRLKVLIMHLLKCQVQPDTMSASWEGTLFEQRSALHQLLEDSPSLRRYIAEFAQKAYADAVHMAVIETGMPAARFPPENPYTVEQLLDRKFVPARPA